MVARPAPAIVSRRPQGGVIALGKRRSLHTIRCIQTQHAAAGAAVESRPFQCARLVFGRIQSLVQPDNQPMQATSSDPSAVQHTLTYWDLMDATPGTVPADWHSTSDPADLPSGFEFVSMDEDLDEGAQTLEAKQSFLSFIRQEANRSAAPDFAKVLYHPTMPHEIRVLKLAPGSYHQPLVADLEHISVKFSSKGWGPRLDPRGANFGISFSKNRKVPYTALSYCWGGGDFVCPIVISGHDIAITRTLDEILRYLRKENDTITLWVDQLCIDQTSTSDKSSQVELMGNVYTRARNTVIWLGKDSGKEAFKALRKLARDTAGVRPELTAEELDVLRHPSGLDAGYAQGMKDLRALLDRAWFQRTWII